MAYFAGASRGYKYCMTESLNAELNSSPADLPTKEECWAAFWEIIGRAAYRIWVSDYRGCEDAGSAARLPSAE